MTKRDVVKKIFHGDISVWIILLLLCCISLVEVFSATSTLAYRQANIWQPFGKHAFIMLISVLATIGVSHIQYKYFKLAILLLPLAALVLFITPLIGLAVHNASRFIRLIGFQFQPSEIAKLACIVYTAFWLSKRDKLSEAMIFKVILWGLIPTCILIAYANFSTAILLGVVCYIMMFLGRISAKRLFKLFASTIITGLILGLLICSLPDDIVKKWPRALTVKQRIIEFVHPSAKQTAENASDASTFVITDANLQSANAKMAIARGGIFGKGPGQSIQRDFLPFPYSDFIYAIIIEEIGLVGGIIVLLLYVMLMIRVGILARRCEKLFPQYLVLGCGMIIVIQAFINIGVTVGLLPVTGQPLPLISQGGTSMVLTCVYMGIIISISHFGAGMDKTAPETEDKEDDVDEPDIETEPDENESENESVLLTVSHPEKTGSFS